MNFRGSDVDVDLCRCVDFATSGSDGTATVNPQQSHRSWVANSFPRGDNARMDSQSHVEFLFVDEAARSGDESARAMLLPRRASEKAAGLDLVAASLAPVEIAPGSSARIPTGVAVALPEGTEGQVRPRSGLAAKHGVTVLNAPGTIDADYRGEIQVLLINHGCAPFVVERGMRIAQLVIAPVLFFAPKIVEKLSATGRGAGGFGSTGSTNQTKVGDETLSPEPTL